MSAKDPFRDPVTFVQHYWTSYEVKPGTKWNDRLDFRQNWWNGVTKTPEQTPMCTRCQEAYKLYCRLMNEMTLEEFIKAHFKCSHHCLWFPWFYQQMQKESTNKAKTIVIKK